MSQNDEIRSQNNDLPQSTLLRRKSVADSEIETTKKLTLKQFKSMSNQPVNIIDYNVNNVLHMNEYND